MGARQNPQRPNGKSNPSRSRVKADPIANSDPIKRIEDIARSAGIPQAELSSIPTSIEHSHWLDFLERQDGRGYEERRDERDRNERREKRQDILTMVVTVSAAVAVTVIIGMCLYLCSSQERDRNISHVLTFVLGSGSGLSGGYALGRNRRKADT